MISVAGNRAWVMQAVSTRRQVTLHWATASVKVRIEAKAAVLPGRRAADVLDVLRDRQGLDRLSLNAVGEPLHRP